MNQAQSAFLQVFMVKGVLRNSEVTQLYRESCERYAQPYSNDRTERNQQMVDFIRTININIRPFHLEVKKGICEEDGTSYYCLINSVENDVTRLASDYTSHELEFFKKLIEIIVDNEGRVGSTAALNVVERLDKKMMRHDAELLLLRLETDQWILQRQGKISLSVRSILELSQYIQQVHPDCVKTCNMCNLVCLKGQMCEECGVKLHQHCANRYFRNTDNPRCPDEDCRAEWPHSVQEMQNGQPPGERSTQRRRLED